MRCFWILSVVVVGIPTAWAVDANDDGCEDVQFASNGACVSEDASLASGVTTVAGTFVGAQASVGPDVALDDVHISPRATLDGWVAHSTKPLTVGLGTVVGRSATLGVDHILGADTTISRAASAGARLTTGNGATVGYAAILGTDVTIDANATVGGLVELGNFTHVGTGAVIGRGSTVADAPNAGLATTILGVVGPDVTIGPDVLIEGAARVRKQATLQSGAQVLGTARIGRGAIVEAGATVGSGAVVRAGATLCEGQALGTSDLVRRGETWPPTGCSVQIVDNGGVREWSNGTYATSCATYKNPGAGETYTGSTGDGKYRIDPDGTGTVAAFDVYCDMTTDGGGWTFFGHVNSNSGGTGFFSDQGSYDPNRGDPNALYSAAGRLLPNLPHTEMMVTLDSAVPATAASANKIVFYQYANGHTGFNSGPLPCVGLTTGFNYRTTTSGAFTSGGTSNACSSTQWYTRTSGSSAYLALLHSTALGTYWGAGMGGDNNWNRDSWWYVR